MSSGDFDRFQWSRTLYSRSSTQWWRACCFPEKWACLDSWKGRKDWEILGWRSRRKMHSMVRVRFPLGVISGLTLLLVSHCFEGLSPGSPVLLSLQKPTSPKFSLTKLEPVQANVLSLKYCNLFTILFIYFKSRYFPFRSHLVTWLSPTTIFVLAFDWKFSKGFWRILKKIEIENARQEQIKKEKLEIFLQYGLKCTDRCYLNPSNPYLRVIAWSKTRTWSSFYAGRWSLAAKYFPCIHHNDLYYMASSVGGQDEPSPTLWLATRAGKSELSCPLGTTRCIPQAKFLRKPYIPFIDQAFSVKMTDIGLVLFLRGQYLAILTSHLVNNPFV